MASWLKRPFRARCHVLLALALAWHSTGLHGPDFAVQTQVRQAAQQIHDEGLELPAKAGRQSFAAVNRVAQGEILATDNEMFLATELRSAAKRADWQEAKALLADYGSGNNTKVLTAAMQAALRCKRYRAGAKIFERLRLAEAALDIPAYTVAMKIFGKLRRTEQVDEIWQTLLDLDVVDQVAAGARIDAAAELGDLPLALDLVAYIKKNRLGINVLHYSSAINACAKSNDPERSEHALRLFNEMVSMNIQPNIITYTNFLLASRDLPDSDLLFILESMKRKGVEANRIFTESFLFVFLGKTPGVGYTWKKRGNIEIELRSLDTDKLKKALELIEDFQKAGIRINRATRKIQQALTTVLADRNESPALLNE